MNDALAQSYLSDAIYEFHRLKSLADKSIAQVSADDFFRTPGPESNSVALIVKHLAGNLRSRWTDFLTSDGEKPDRHRDQEFEVGDDETQASILDTWEDGWRLLFNAMESLTPSDLNKTILIRAEPHTVLKSIQRQLTHQAYHIGQIVFLAKHMQSANWQTLSIPRGRSEQFNAEMLRRFETGPKS